MVAGTLPVVETTQSVGRCCNLRPGGKYVDNRGMDHHEHADDLLRRALLDKEASAAVALRVTGLPLCEELTVVFHGRRDLGTIQTYVTNGGRGAGSAVAADELLRVPCDLDLAAAEDREEAEHLYAEQASAMRDALVGADTVLDIWREPLSDVAHSHVQVDRRIALDVDVPAHRLLPAALVAPERQIVVTAVCGARPLAEGRPPMGLVCVRRAARVRRGHERGGGAPAPPGRGRDPPLPAVGPGGPHPPHRGRARGL